MAVPEPEPTDTAAPETEPTDREREIIGKFKTISCLAIPEPTLGPEEPDYLWVDICSPILELAKEIQASLGSQPHEEFPKMQERVNISDAAEALKAVYECAREATSPEAHQTWRSACTYIICTIRRAQQLLERDLEVDVFPPNSDVFTRPTGDPGTSALPLGSIAEAWEQEAQTSHPPQKIFREHREDELPKLLEIIANFKTIRDSAVHDGQEDPAELWEDASKIMALAKDIQTKIGAAELFDAFPKMQECDSVVEMFQAVRRGARDMASSEAHQTWASACVYIICAMRRVQQLLKQALRVGVLPDSEAFSAPTSQADTQPLSVLDLELEDEAEDAHRMVWQIFSGNIEAKIQALEHQLLELQVQGSGGNNPEIAQAQTLHELGIWSHQAGDFYQARQHLEESLRLRRTLHGDEDHPDVAETLHELGLLTLKAGDHEKAKLDLEESLRISRSVHGAVDHPVIAATLRAVGASCRQAGALQQAKQHLEESRRMSWSMHGYKDHSDMSATLRELGLLSQQVGDFELAKQRLQESFRMYRSVRGNLDDPNIAATVHALGALCRHSGDLGQAQQELQESLRMSRSVHGDKDHPDIAATLHELGLLSQQAGKREQAKQHLEESLRMKRSVHLDKNHPDIALTLHELENLIVEV